MPVLAVRQGLIVNQAAPELSDVELQVCTTTMPSVSAWSMKLNYETIPFHILFFERYKVETGKEVPTLCFYH